MAHRFSNQNPPSPRFVDPYRDRRGTGPKKPRQPLPRETPDFWDLGDGLAMAWLGHSSVFLRMNGKNILIDPIFNRYSSPVPFIGPKRFPGEIITPAQLPKIDLHNPGKVIGSNTDECMKSGAVYGTACMLDGLIDRVEKELGEKVTVVGTGGLAPVIMRHCTHDIILEDDLLLLGLGVIYAKNTRR